MVRARRWGAQAAQGETLAVNATTMAQAPAATAGIPKSGSQLERMRVPTQHAEGLITKQASEENNLSQPLEANRSEAAMLAAAGA